MGLLNEWITLPMTAQNASPSALISDTLATVKTAAGIALEMREQRKLNPTLKNGSDKQDWFTAADGKVQDYLCSTLARTMPGGSPIGFKGEEKDGRTTRGHPEATYRWLVDPIDGTKPFKEGGHEWSVSVALQQRVGSDRWKTLGGVLYCSAPADQSKALKGTLYWAEYDKDGAYAIDCATHTQRRLAQPKALGTQIECNVPAQPSAPAPQPDNIVSPRFESVIRNAMDRSRLTPSYTRSICHTSMQAIEGHKYATLFEVGAHDWDIGALALIAQKSGIPNRIAPVGTDGRGEELFSTMLSWDQGLLDAACTTARRTVQLAPLHAGAKR